MTPGEPVFSCSAVSGHLALARIVTRSERVRRYLRNCRTDVVSCPRPLDRAAVATSSVGRLMASAVNAATTRYLGSRLLPAQWLLLRDVRVENVDGRFVCRRQTSDHTIVREDYERALRPYFELDDGVFVDVGSHIGKYAVSVGRRLRATGRVIAIEPEASNFAALEANIRENGLRNVTAANAACGAADGAAVIHVDQREPIGHSMNRPVGPPQAVIVRALDSLLPELNVQSIQMLKLDVEGMELDALKGAVRTLKNSPAAKVLIEIEHDEAPLRFLGALGFEITPTHHRFGRSGRYYLATGPNAPAVAMSSSR